jgi:hypothetical protein
MIKKENVARVTPTQQKPAIVVVLLHQKTEQGVKSKEIPVNVTH